MLGFVKILQAHYWGWGVFIHGNHAPRWENGSSWWGCLCDVCFATKKASERKFFVPSRTHLGVKLLTSIYYVVVLVIYYVDHELRFQHIL